MQFTLCILSRCSEANTDPRLHSSACSSAVLVSYERLAAPPSVPCFIPSCPPPEIPSDVNQFCSSIHTGTMQRTLCTCMCVDFSEHVWIFNHLPVELTVNEEALVASMMPSTQCCYTTLESLAMSQQVAEAAGARAASEQGTGRQLLVSGRHARTHAFLKTASSYRRPPLHTVPATVTGKPRVQAHSTDNHPVLDRTLTLLELKRCQVCVCRSCLWHFVITSADGR